MKDIQRKKLIRVTTADISLNSLLKGQLKFLNQYFEVVGVAKDTGVLKEVSEREGIRVVDAPLERPISLVKDIKGLWFLYRLFRKEKPWCVHANTPKGSLLAMIAAWFACVPHRIYTVTGLRYQGAHGMLRTILKTMERLSCLFATNVIPEGQGVLQCLKRDNITKKSLQVIHYGNINGKDTEFFSCDNTIQTASLKLADKQIILRNLSEKEARSLVRSELGFSNNDFIFVFIGRLVNDKGLGELADALRKLEDEKLEIKLLLIGEIDGEDDALAKDKLNYLMQSKNVKYIGVQSDIRPYLMASDVLVFPSYREGFPNVPLEAGALGLPAIVTNINGSNEIIEDGVNGKIIQAPLDNKGVRVNDITIELYTMMKWFYYHPEEVKRMGENARPIICERYEQHNVWKALLEYYKQL
ncbi:glycosyltransferase family 4 protein [Prevotella melaninogenica]|uniref:glycosyltransferase family 4 protein n=1 Tax=Prevotella melaninogenica TaxID=28132 RepID=UPI001BA88D7A|nr:glycosyltransferase family 4 protein [Prevotella melaninogenica]QUB68805.1 glycosyltransferase family 4 protein [Prevotella melaninogenica]